MQVHGKKIKTKVKRITTTLLSEILEHNLTPYIYYILTRRTRLALTLFYYYLFTIAAPMIGLHVVGIFFFVKSLHGPLLFTTSVVYHHYYPLARLVLKAPLSLLPHPSGAVTHPLQVLQYFGVLYCRSILQLLLRLSLVSGQLRGHTLRTFDTARPSERAIFPGQPENCGRHIISAEGQFCLVQGQKILSVSVNRYEL